MGDVARRAGVSVTTVSHVLNGTRKVQPETEKAVKAAMQEAGYTPNILARALAQSRTNTIGVAISAVSNHYFNDIVRAIENESERHGLMIFLSDTRDDAEHELRIVKALHQRRVDGIILAPAADPERRVFRYLEENKLPVVLIDRLVPENFDQVGVENAKPMADIVRHLASHGHRRIGFIAGKPGLSTSDERQAGYLQGLQQAGLPFDPALVLCGQSQIEPARASVHRLLALEQAPTAIISSNNLMTIGVMRGFRDLRLEVPKDIALVGFDDFDWADSFSPRLTVMDQPCEAIGAMAVQLMMARINDPDSARQTVRLAPELRIRNSCGCHDGAE
ncbi:LacI family DNA-binding transcriptional regulator [Janthinobacterium agaricidamnosum]|uniref:LacI family DNA-binding transcriptional regulator n=1 Tax=Janthinobacterium agaricidamnosum TaxID=55508 RepID=UPI000570BB84|nr:LacI family DNA-binding transcriptional regulator [Janthinobacterium agaricidamnosum]